MSEIPIKKPHKVRFLMPIPSPPSSGDELPISPSRFKDSVNKVISFKNMINLYKEVTDYPPLHPIHEPSESYTYKVFKNYQKFIYVLLEQPMSSKRGVCIFLLILLAILVNITEAIFYKSSIESESSVKPLRNLNATVLLILIAEFMLRLFSATAFNKKFSQVVFQASYLIDLISIAPLIIQVFLYDVGVTHYIVISLLKICSILKLLRYSQGIFILKKVLLQSIGSISFLMFIILISNVIFAIMIYYAEALNSKSRIAKGIPTALWWSIVTITTVGYGDVAPVTPLGKVIGSFVSIYGTVMLALPVVIIGYHFQEIYNSVEEEKLDGDRQKGQVLDGRKWF